MKAEGCCYTKKGSNKPMQPTRLTGGVVLLGDTSMSRLPHRMM